MKFTITVLPLAVEDIEEIHRFILNREGSLRADKALDGLEQSIRGLTENANRGHSLPELVSLGFKDVLEIHFKPYRIIYKLGPKDVVVFIVADGRRDLQELLEKRTLR
jgi:toxin ParE1/3/4